MKKQHNGNWNGGLTIENIEEIGNLILNTLQGKKYCFVSQNYGYSEETATKVRTNQCFENGTNGSPFSFWYGEDGDYAGFNFCDTYGVWGCSTSKHNSDLNFNWDSTYEAPYIVVEHGQVKIIQRNGHGEIICWIIAIQDNNE